MSHPSASEAGSEGGKQWNVASSAVGMFSTLISLALTFATADFFKPALRWLPYTLVALFACLSLVIWIIRRRLRRPVLHWSFLISFLGLIMAALLVIFEHKATPAGKTDVGLIGSTLEGNLLQQRVLSLTEVQRKDLQTRVQVVPTDSPVKPTPPGPAQSRVEELEELLKQEDPNKRESAAQDALARTQDASTRRMVIRTIYRTKDPVLREMVILQSLKAFEGKSIPLLTAANSRADAERSNGGASVSTVPEDKLKGYMIGSSISIKSVDLETASFSGTFNTGHSAELHGTITADGLQFSSAVTGPGFGAFALQVRLIPQDNLRLSGEATGNGSSTQVELELPF